MGNMKKILPLIASMAIILVAGIFASAGTMAWFSDTEKSYNNTIIAGSLDLKVDGDDTNVVKITIENWSPGHGPYLYTYEIKNTGTIKGYLDLSKVEVIDYENGLIEPEREAGDTSGGNPGKGNGELSSVLRMHMFVDNDPANGWYGSEDVTIYNGPVNGVASSYDLNLEIPAGGTTHITIQVGWWSTANDNLAQTDSLKLNIEFCLSQNP